MRKVLFVYVHTCFNSVKRTFRLSKEAFDTNRGLWLATQQQELYPNPHLYAIERETPLMSLSATMRFFKKWDAIAHQLNWYRFIGRILGKALYEGILVDVAFASFFLAKWLGKQSYLDDLASLDPELYNGLIFLKHYDQNFEDLSLNFTISVEGKFPLPLPSIRSLH